MKLLGSTKSKITKNKNGENVPPLEITKVEIGQLWNVSPENFIFLKIFDSEFSHSDVWFTDQNSKPLEIEDKINITLVIN